MSNIFNPYTDSFAQNPYPAYDWLRMQEGLYFFEDMNMWMASRLDDISLIATHDTMVRSLEAFLSPEEILEHRRASNWHDMPYHQKYVQTNLLDTDGPTHRRLRNLIFSEFTMRSVTRHKMMIQHYIDHLLLELLECREIDFVADFAAHIPGHIIGNVIGIPDEDCALLRRWSEDIVQFYNLNRTNQHKQLAEQTTAEFCAYLKDIIKIREKNPQEDLLSKLITLRNAGNMTETELISTAMLILMAGHGSTIDVLGSGMHAFLRFPDQMLKLRRNPELITQAVQEMFRFESPLPFFHRYTTQDTNILGQDYKKGTAFGLLYGAANRDPAHFSHANQFDITRTPNRHIAFGRGAHLCLGNHLSRLDMEVVFLTLLKNTQDINLIDDTPRYKRGLSVRGPEQLKIKLLS